MADNLFKNNAASHSSKNEDLLENSNAYHPSSINWQNRSPRRTTAGERVIKENRKVEKNATLAMNVVNESRGSQFSQEQSSKELNIARSTTRVFATSRFRSRSISEEEILQKANTETHHCPPSPSPILRAYMYKAQQEQSPKKLNITRSKAIVSSIPRFRSRPFSDEEMLQKANIEIYSRFRSRSISEEEILQKANTETYHGPPSPSPILRAYMYKAQQEQSTEHTKNIFNFKS